MIDFDKIKTIYQFGRNVSLSDIQVLLSTAKSKSFAPSEYLIKEGTITKDVFFIRKGLVRAFVINEKGDEITTALRVENQLITSPDIILFNQPARAYYQAIEPTDTYRMDYDVLQSIISKNPKLEASRKYIFQNLMKDAYRRIETFVLLSPEERYIDFVDTNPDLVNRVPDKYIANVLGITPVSLSRIRKRIAERRK